jgi:hypothetical protein
VAQTSFSDVDPDGIGPATGAVTFRFEIISTQSINADGIGLSCIFQSDYLMATPTNTVRPLGPIATGTNWIQEVDNRSGNVLSALSYGGKPFNARMIITFNQALGNPNINISTNWTPICEITYWTKGRNYPQGGYILNEQASVVAQNELSANGGLSTYPLAQGNFSSIVPLGGPLPALFSNLMAVCNSMGTAISWSSLQEANSNYFDIEKSSNGIDWTLVGTVQAAGLSNVTLQYQQLDLTAGDAMYRIKCVTKNNQFIYSNIIRTNCAPSTLPYVIYPLPAIDILHLAIRSDIAIGNQLLIYDIQGKLVKRIDAPISIGNNHIIINLNGLSAGMYILKSSNKNPYINKIFTKLW